MTEETKKKVRELIQREADMHKIALEYKATSQTLDADFHEVAEEYRLSAQHFADGAKLCAERVSSLIKNAAS